MRFLLPFWLIVFASHAIAQCNFSSGNYIDELTKPSDILSINIRIPESAKFAQNNFKIITSNSKNIPPKLKKKFSAEVTIKYKFGNCKYGALVRQSGDWKDHIKFSKVN